MQVECVGECMVELLDRPPGAAAGPPVFACGGDTFNTAVYLRRTGASLGLDLAVGFRTGLGDDAASEAMRRVWATEGLLDHATVIPGRAPGRYRIRTDAHGERRFDYRRAGSAAAAMFADPVWPQDLAADLVYLSGITLQLTGPASFAALLDRLEALRDSGTRIVLDSNYRPAGWPDPETARAHLDAVLGHTDIALVTLEDEIALGGIRDVRDCVERLRSAGVREIAIKLGAAGALVADARDAVAVPGTRVATPVDTTAAGDSFNGAYLAARIAGEPAVEAARQGNILAATVIGFRGAIIPATPPPSVQLADRTG